MNILARYEVSAHSERFFDADFSLPDSLDSDLQSIVETLSTAERGAGCLQLAQRRQDRHFHYLWLLIMTHSHGTRKCTL